MTNKIFLGIYYSVAMVGALNLSLVYAQNGEPIQPLPSDTQVDQAKASFGKDLFFDTRLSVDESISCASCHDIGAWGAEAKSVSEGVKKQLGDRNSPTVFNATFNFKQFWDGRADDLSHQAEAPVVNPVEMGMSSWADVVGRLKKDAEYVAKAKQLFGQEISKQVIVDAIAEYEKTLVTPDSPFDRFLRGDARAISAQQKRGYELFKSYGCVACHQGKNVGGNMFQKFGVLEDISMKAG